MIESLTAEIIQAIKLGKSAAFLYDRISSSGQEDGLSLEYQEANGLKYAERKNLHIVKIFNVVESAWKDRKNYEQMLNLASRLNVKHLIFKNSERLSRNIANDLKRLKDMIENEGINVHLYESGMIVNAESRPDEKWMMQQLILIAEKFSADLSYKIKNVYKYKVNKGISPTRFAWGYVYDKKEQRHRIDPPTERHLRFIFDTFDTGEYSVRQLVDLLNSHGIKTPWGYDWRPSKLHAILTNPFYSGDFIYKGDLYRGTHEAYFTRDRFKKRLKRLKMKNVGMRKYDRQYAFTRMLRCGSCGRTLIGMTSKQKYIYYVHKHAGGRETESIREDAVVKMLDAEMARIKYSDEIAGILKELFEKSLKLKTDGQEEMLKVINKKLSECETEKDRLVKLYGRGLLDPQLLKRNIDDYDRQIDALEGQRRKLRIDRSDYICRSSTAIEWVKSMPDIYSEADTAGKAAILKYITESINIDKKEIRIHWRDEFKYILDPRLVDAAEKVLHFPVRRARQDMYQTFEPIVSDIVAEWIMAA
jgi:hypothetical protein